MGAIINAISTLLAKIAALVKWFGDLFVACFVAIWDLVKDSFCWVFEGALDISLTALNSIDVSAVTVGGWGSIPSEVMNILSVLGVGQAVTIITSAIGIRLLLQLIPFVRLGS